MKSYRQPTHLLSYLVGMLLLTMTWLPAHAGLFTPEGEFQDIECNQIITDSTIGQSNSFSNTDYASCEINGAQYDAGDRLYRLVIDDSTSANIVLDELDGANLVLVLLSNTVDPETMMDCPDTCIAFTSSGSLDMTLPPGVFWIVVDGEQDGSLLQEGNFQLSIECPKEFSNIGCGQVVEGSTIDRVSNFDLLDFAGCFDEIVNTYNAGDQLYRFEINETKTIDITLEKLDNQGLHLFLLYSGIDISDGSVCPGECIGLSDTGSTVERITATLPLGIYWLVVDGNVLPGVPEDMVDEGNFRLSIDCPKDFSVINCDESVMGSTSGRIDNFGADDYTTCGGGDYSQGDVTYQWELMDRQKIVINLNPEEGIDLDLILMSSTLDELSQVLCPDTCIAIAAESAGAESIQMTLPGGTYFIVVDALTDVGSYMLEVMCEPLPIQLVQFEGKSTSEGNIVSWETASELLFEGFYLQRSQTGLDWTNLGWIDGKGGISQGASYQYLDPAPLSGANFYQLKSLDLDGSFELSGIIRVDVQADEIVLFPSPAQDHIVISGIEQGAPAEYFIRSPLGQLLGKGIISSSRNSIDISEIASGPLFLTLQYENQVKTFTIQKL